MLTPRSDSGFAVLQPAFRLGKWGKGQFFILRGASFIRTALAKTAVTNPSLFSAISNSVPKTRPGSFIQIAVVQQRVQHCRLIA